MRNPTTYPRRAAALATMSLFFMLGCGGRDTGPFDVVIEGGRVIDVESDRDEIANVGIRDGHIAAIHTDEMTGARIIDATGLVVSAGFIDLHEHGQNDESYRLMVRDGVTSAFELEVGTGDVNAWYAEREGGQRVNYGVSIGHIRVRMIVMGDEGDFLPSGPGGHEPATDDQIAEMARRIEEGLSQGAVAVGFGTAYTPAATMAEVEQMFRVAAANDASAHVHVRGGVAGLSETIDAADRAGVALHVVHANSSGGDETVEFIDVIREAAASGQDVTTEAYPYSAGMTMIESALFDDWETWDDVRFGQHQWVETGERLTRQTFARYRQQGGEVIIHSRTEELTRAAIGDSLVMIASDGFIVDARGHPRTSGTYAKVLGRYVRDVGLVDLKDALRRMTLEPARRLEARVPAMRQKGRVQVGADADLTLFDPEKVIDRATYLDATVPSAGIPYVLVNGVVVVEQGELVAGVQPGTAVIAPRAR